MLGGQETAYSAVCVDLPMQVRAAGSASPAGAAALPHASHEEAIGGEGMTAVIAVPPCPLRALITDGSESWHWKER